MLKGSVYNCESLVKFNEITRIPCSCFESKKYFGCHKAAQTEPSTRSTIKIKIYTLYQSTLLRYLIKKVNIESSKSNKSILL